MSLKDTVDDSASLDVALLAEVQLDELPEAAGVVVVDGLGVSKGLHDGTVDRNRKYERPGRQVTLLQQSESSRRTCSPAAPPPRVTSRLWTPPPASAGSCRTGTSGSAWCFPFSRRRSLR